MEFSILLILGSLVAFACLVQLVPLFSGLFSQEVDCLYSARIFGSVTMASKKRKVTDEGRVFKEDWTNDYFFIESKGKPVCLICQKTVAAMKEYNIKRHYESEHKGKFDTLTGELRKSKVSSLKASLIGQQNIFKKQCVRNESGLCASYVVAELIAKAGRPFTDSEFVKQCLLAVTEEVCPDKIKSFQDISLSARTCARRTEELGANLFEQLKLMAQSFDCYALAMDESNDISDTAQLLIFIRGIDANFTVHEELAGMCSLKGTTTGEDLFLKLKETLASLELNWEKLTSITTDGGRNMCGAKTGVVGRVFEEAKQAGSTPMAFHCIIHQEALCCKILSLKEIMDIVTSTVNYIRRNGLTHRQFQHFLEEIETEYGDVVYYSAVRWLSRGAVLKRFFYLRSEIDIFMTEKKKPVPQLSDDKWIMSLAFLVDITTYLNDLNVKLQGKGKLLSDMYFDVKAFEVKLKFLHKKMNEQNLDHFPFCKIALESFIKPFQWETQKNNFINIIEELQREFSSRFADFYARSNEIRLFQNPFAVDIDDVPAQMQMELIELQANDFLKDAFAEGNLLKFYSGLSIFKFSCIKTFAKK